MLSGAQRTSFFNWRYYLIKWGIPVLTGLFAAFLVALALTGMISVPSVVSAMGVTTLETFASMTILLMAMGTAASFVGFVSSLFVDKFLLSRNETRIVELETVNFGLTEDLQRAREELKVHHQNVEKERQSLWAENAKLHFNNGRLDRSQNPSPANSEQAQPMASPELRDAPPAAPAPATNNVPHPGPGVDQPAVAGSDRSSRVTLN